MTRKTPISLVRMAKSPRFTPPSYSGTTLATLITVVPHWLIYPSGPPLDPVWDLSGEVPTAWAPRHRPGPCQVPPRLTHLTATGRHVTTSPLTATPRHGHTPRPTQAHPATQTPTPRRPLTRAELDAQRDDAHGGTAAAHRSNQQNTLFTPPTLSLYPAPPFQPAGFSGFSGFQGF